MPAAVKAVNGLGAYAWAFNGVVVATMIATVVGGDFSDRHGPRIPLLGGLLVFVGGLVVAATASTMLVFVVGRVLQGLGGGTAIVAVYVLVARGYDESLRAQVFSAMAGAWVLPSLVGPAIAGALAQWWSWRVVFLSVIPIVVVAMWMVLPLLRRVEVETPSSGEIPERTGRTRWAATLAAGAVLVQDGGHRRGAVGAIEALVGLVMIALALRELLPTGSLRLARGLPSAMATRGLLAGGFFGAQAFVPLMLVDQRGLSLTLAGLSLTTSTLGWFAGSWWQGRPSHQQAREKIIVVGAVAAMAGMLLMVLVVVLPLPALLAAVAWAIGGTGMGATVPAVNVWVLGHSAVDEQGANSAALQLSDSSGVLVATAIAGSVYAASSQVSGQQAVTFIALFLAMCGVGVIALFASARLHELGANDVQVRSVRT